MFRPTRSLVGIVVGALALSALGAGAVGAKPKPKPGGRKDSGVIYSAITHTAGKTEYLAGNVSDKLLGAGAVTYNASVGTGATPGTIKISGSVTAFFKNGSITGKATATLTTSATGALTITNGKITARAGTGGLKGHSLVATFTATASAVTGPFVFHYQGIYR